MSSPTNEEPMRGGKSNPTPCDVCKESSTTSGVLSPFYKTFQHAGSDFSRKSLNIHKHKYPACASCVHPSTRDIFDYVFLVFLRGYGVWMISTHFSEVLVLVCDKTTSIIRPHNVKGLTSQLPLVVTIAILALAVGTTMTPVMQGMVPWRIMNEFYTATVALWLILAGVGMLLLKLLKSFLE